jgi:hypothetical protein
MTMMFAYIKSPWLGDRRTGGLPQFVEELTRAVLESARSS